MNWIKENRFLFGLILIVVIGVGVLGYLVFGAKGRYDAAVEDYQRKMGELNGLQKLPTYPNQKNLDKLAEQKAQVNSEVSALAATLAAQQIPMEDLSPEAFQDRLKAVATAIRTKASGGNPLTKLPSDKFFLGFERYETAPPAREAAAALGRELKAIDWVVNKLLDNRVAEIRSLTRDELPEEKGRVRPGEKKAAATPAPAKPAPGKGPPAKGGAAATVTVDHQVESHRIDLVFVADQARFRQVLNAITEHKGQFFIVRTLAVKNEKQTAPGRVLAAAADGSAPATPPVDPAAPPAAAAAPAIASTYLVGEEKIEVTLVLEFVEFSEETAK